jgi:hypothetical protein
MRQEGIQVEGVRALVRDIRKIEPQLVKELGQRNKSIGQSIIDRAFPKPEKVGAGAGAMPRASATANVLRIMAGGSHRTEHRQQWGKTPQPRDVKRPYLRQAAVDQMPRVQREYLDALLEAARKSGIQAKKGISL